MHDAQVVCASCITTPVINWLIQSIADHPDLAHAKVPTGLLSEAEQAHFATLRYDKRRRDWLLGRWTAKHLLRAYIEQHTNHPFPLDSVSILSDPNGAPRLIAHHAWHPLANEAEASPRDLSELCLSISHSHDRAFCTLSDAPGVSVGADIERILPRPTTFIEDYFNDAEQTHIQQMPTRTQATIATALWSAKEAALKALRLGLTVDTRAIGCALSAPTQPGGWAEIQIRCYAERLPIPIPPSLVGWWRINDHDVLTLVVARTPTPQAPTSHECGASRAHQHEPSIRLMKES